MRTVAIPGGHASFREEHELRTRDNRLLEVTQTVAARAFQKLVNTSESGVFGLAELAEAGLNEAEATSVFRVRDAKIVAALVEWTRDEPLPTLETMGDLPPDVYEALAEATDPVVVEKVNFEPSDPKALGFEDSPTPPSDGSGVVLRADLAPESSLSSESGGTSINSARNLPA